MVSVSSPWHAFSRSKTAKSPSSNKRSQARRRSARSRRNSPAPGTYPARRTHPLTQTRAQGDGMSKAACQQARRSVFSTRQPAPLIPKCPDMTKPPEGGFVAAGCAILQTGHFLDSCQHFIVRAVCTSALRRHGIDALDCRRQQSVQTTLCVRAGLPGSGIMILRRTQQADAMASVAVLGDDVATATRGTTSSCSGDCTHALALLARYADFTYRLQALGNGIVGRSLSAHRP